MKKMFMPGDHHYRIDQQRRNRLLHEARREQLLRKALLNAPKTPRAVALLLLQLLHSLAR